MKQEDIEKLDIGQLEKIGDNESVQVPAGLEDKVVSAILAAEISRSEPKRAVRILMPVFAAAASIALVLTLRTSGPQDSFSDPALAYAEVTKTLEFVSSKMSKGGAAATQTIETIEKIHQLF